MTLMKQKVRKVNFFGESFATIVTTQPKCSKCYA